MKVCILTTSYPRFEGDYAGNFIHNLAKELVKNKIKVSVVAPHDINTKNYEILDGVEVYRFQYWFTKKNQKVAYGGGMLYNLRESFFAKIQFPFFIIFLFLSCLRITKKNDFIHAQFLLTGLIGLFVKKITGKKLILTIHAGDLFGLEKIPFKRNIAKLIAFRTDKINCVSKYIKDRFLNLLSSDVFLKIHDQIIVMPMGVSLERFTNIINPQSIRIEKISNKTILLFVGRISDKKGLSTLIDSISILQNLNDDVQLSIVGDGPLRKQLEKRVDELKLNKYIRFMGMISDRELTDLYISSDIVIVPSIITEYGDTEGLPVVILEAMAAGKPIIASNVSGIPDVIKDGINGFLVEQKNQEQLAEKICYLIEHTDERIQMGINGRKLVEEKFTWEKIAGKTLEIYNDLLRESE